ncbi:MAG: NFACT RNA binding domain-containing protein [Candidatus Eisenbacteria bacterium]
MSEPLPQLDRRGIVTRVLRRYHARLARKLEALRGDLAEAERAVEFRVSGEALLTYLKQVSPRASETRLPDPADHNRTLTIALDPKVSAQVNAARYFKKAAKAERGLKEVPPRLRAVEAEAHALERLIRRVTELEEAASDTARVDDPTLDDDLEAALAKLPETLRGGLRALPATRGAGGAGDTTHSGTGSARRPRPSAVARGEQRAPSARLQPRRLRTREGWAVLIGRNNDGNDYVTHVLARPEDYWFHVHGCPGSHVVLRRGKGKNEPSKATVDEVAGWAAFYSQARTAGRVPVIVTRKKYVRKPRKGPPGLALCTNEKTVMIRPQEPPRESEADRAASEDPE